MLNAAFPLVAPISGSGSSTDSYVLANPLDVNLSLAGVSYVDDAGITSNDTNYGTISVELDGDEAASLATTTTGSGDIAADTPKAVPVSNANLVVAPGGKIEVKLAKAGSGVAVAGRVVLALKPHA